MELENFDPRLAFLLGKHWPRPLVNLPESLYLSPETKGAVMATGHLSSFVEELFYEEGFVSKKYFYIHLFSDLTLYNYRVFSMSI